MKILKALDPRIRRLLRVQSRLDGSSVDPGRESLCAASYLVEPAESKTVPLSESITPVLVELADNKVPEGFLERNWAQIAEGIYSVDLPLDSFVALNDEPNVLFVEAGKTLNASLDTSLSEVSADKVLKSSSNISGASGKGVVVGIIDYGFDWTLDDFRNPDGTTRCEWIWDQSLQPEGDESSPSEFEFGVEYSAAEINSALIEEKNGADPFEFVRHKPPPGSHGTHVTGIALGNGSSFDDNFPKGTFVGVAPEAQLIFVQLRTKGDGNFTDSVNAARAISYIYQKAEKLDRPCVINLSVGSNGGSHDGESLVERAIDQLLLRRGRFFVKSAGNENIWRGHAQGRIRSGETRTLTWKVSEDLSLPNGDEIKMMPDWSRNELEIWYSSRDRFRVRVVTPSGFATAWVDPNGQPVDLPSTNYQNKISIENERFTELNGDSLIYIEVDNSSLQPIEPGDWKIELHSIESLDGNFDAWIERDNAGSRRQQSFFIEEDFVSSRTISMPGTFRRGVTVANYDHHGSSPRINQSSGRGTTRDGRHKPELAAPGTNIISCFALGGRLMDGGAAIYPIRYRNTGTSMAAPHVTGTAALLMERHPELTAAQIKGILVASTRMIEGGSTKFREDFGYGLLDAEEAYSIVAKVFSDTR